MFSTDIQAKHEKIAQQKKLLDLQKQQINQQHDWFFPKLQREEAEVM
jgi:hypothetical protein